MVICVVNYEDCMSPSSIIRTSFHSVDNSRELPFRVRFPADSETLFFFYIVSDLGVCGTIVVFIFANDLITLDSEQPTYLICTMKCNISRPNHTLTPICI